MKLVSLVVFILIPIGAWADTQADFKLPSGVNVTIVEGAFDAKQFQIDGCSDKDNKCTINGRIPAGVAFGLPSTFVKSIVVSSNGKKYLLDSSGMYNAWGGRPLKVKGVVRYFGGKCIDALNCRFRGLFSDAAGTYVAEWSIVGGVSTRTVLTDSDDIVGLFMKHIDPPGF
jgi:hypothetical protein